MKKHPKYKSILVSEDGKIFHADTNKRIPWHIKPEGYMVISVPDGPKGKRTSTRRYVHRLVAETYIPNPEDKPQVNHKDMDKTNNHVSNLEWMTSKENMIHLYKNADLDVNGTNNPTSKWSEELIRYTCSLLEQGMRNIDISKITGLPTQTVSDIRCRKVWAHIGKEYKMKVERKKRRSPDTILAVAELLEDKETPKRISRELGVSLGEVYDIKHGVLFGDLTKDFKFRQH